MTVRDVSTFIMQGRDGSLWQEQTCYDDNLDGESVFISKSVEQNKFVFEVWVTDDKGQVTKSRVFANERRARDCYNSLCNTVFFKTDRQLKTEAQRRAVIAERQRLREEKQAQKFYAEKADFGAF